MNRLLVIGAGREQLPAIDRAHARGLEVVATDLDPAAPGSKLADHFHVVSTADVEGNIATARRERVDGVMTLSSETAVPTVAAVAEALGLPGFSRRTAKLATDKLAMKDGFVRHDVPTSPHRAIAGVDDARAFTAEHGYPVVLKPAVLLGRLHNVLAVPPNVLRKMRLVAAEDADVKNMVRFQALDKCANAA